MEKYINENELKNLDDLIEQTIQDYDRLYPEEQQQEGYYLITDGSFDNVLAAKELYDLSDEQQWEVVQDFIQNNIKQFDIISIDYHSNRLLQGCNNNVGKVEKIQAAKRLDEILEKGIDIIDNIEYEISLLKDYIDYSDEYVEDSEDSYITLTILDFWENVLEVVQEQLQ